GDVAAVLVIPPTFSRDLAAGRGAAVQLLIDGSNANTATIALGYADAVVARYSGRVALRARSVAPVSSMAAPVGAATRPAAAAAAPISAETRVWYNPTLESRNMVVPGLIAVIMSIIAATLTSLTVAREWERGTMEQLASTPVHRLEVVFGKLLPYVAIGL